MSLPTTIRGFYRALYLYIKTRRKTMSLPTVNGVARLTKDVEMKYLNSGIALAKVTLASSEKFKKQNGEIGENTIFLEATAFGKIAEIMSLYMEKGTMVYYTGKLKQESWNDKTTGQKRNKISLTIATIEIIGRRKSDTQQQASQPQQQNPYAQQASQQQGKQWQPQQQQQRKQQQQQEKEWEQQRKRQKEKKWEQQRKRQQEKEWEHFKDDNDVSYNSLPNIDFSSHSRQPRQFEDDDNNTSSDSNDIPF